MDSNSNLGRYAANLPFSFRFVRVSVFIPQTCFRPSDPAALRAKALLGEHSEIIGGMRGAPLSGFRAELLATLAGLVASDGNFKKFNLKVHAPSASSC